jgi:exocyst complex protein 7
LASQITSIRKSLSNNTFFAFELYSTLLALQPRWESAVRELTGDAKLVNVIAEQSAVLRGVCLRSFPEILVDVKSPMVASRRSAGDVQTVGVADVTYSVGAIPQDR